MPQDDDQMSTMLEALRESFDRALQLDVKGLTERLDRIEVTCQRLGDQLTEVAQAVAMLRQVASEHESRLKICEDGPGAD